MSLHRLFRISGQGISQTRCNCWRWHRDARIWLDFGSGGGFPGVVLACAMGDRSGHVHLVERNAKKAAFLREALRVTQAPGTVHLADIGDFVDRSPAQLDCITARAVAPLHQVIGFAAPLIQPGRTKALFLKGQDVETELTEATRYWNISPRLHASLTGQGWIVELDQVERHSPSAAATMATR